MHSRSISTKTAFMTMSREADIQKIAYIPLPVERRTLDVHQFRDFSDSSKTCPTCGPAYKVRAKCHISFLVIYKYHQAAIKSSNNEE
ncbi:hypothetical protein HI914_00957 [Erysiphe necator]|nr:hypothetical protein HI914_00957 [Erysiphe necator]